MHNLEMCTFGGMKTLRICAVSYYNTLPFIYGIEFSGLINDFKLDLQVPSVCARKLIDNEADISLVPVGALPMIQNYRFVSKLCIGAISHVKSVLLLSNVEIEDIKTIYLDTDSLTSVNLARILAKFHWKIFPAWRSLKSFSGKMKVGDSMVLIGDKTFGVCKQFCYCYDLAKEWNKFTRLPFVFAAWVSKNIIPSETEKNFQQALAWGVEHRKESVQLAGNLHIPVEELVSYLENDISFELDDSKMKGLTLYYELLKQI